MKFTVAVLLSAGWLCAQTGQTLPGRKADPKLPGEPGVMHPLPVPKTTPDPVPVKDAKKKSAGEAGGGPSSSTTKKKSQKSKKVESPKEKTETQP